MSYAVHMAETFGALFGGFALWSWLLVLAADKGKRRPEKD